MNLIVIQSSSCIDYQFTWESANEILADLPNAYQTGVRIRVTADDGAAAPDTDTPGINFTVDNNDEPIAANIVLPGGRQLLGNITVTYDLSDDLDNDTTLLVEYSTEGGFTLEAAGLLRTARKLAEGKVFVPRSVWGGSE